MLEVGVGRGGTGALLAKRAQGKTTYLCDTFTGVVKASSIDPTYRDGEHADTSADEAKAALALVGASAEIRTGTARLLMSGAQADQHSLGGNRSTFPCNAPAAR